MTKRAFPAVVGAIGLCLFLSASRVRGAERLPFDGSLLDRSSQQLPLISLEDTQQFFFAASFGWMQPTADFLPTFNPVQPRSVASSKDMPNRRDLLDEEADLQAHNPIYVGGQIGFLYGRSSGKYGIEYERGYVIGEIGTDKFHLTVGTTYERSNGRVPRWGR